MRLPLVATLHLVLRMRPLRPIFSQTVLATKGKKENIEKTAVAIQSQLLRKRLPRAS